MRGSELNIEQTQLQMATQNKKVVLCICKLYLASVVALKVPSILGFINLVIYKHMLFKMQLWGHAAI